MAASPIAAEKVDYQGLKSWIAAQEAFEAATKEPAPLTPVQRQAVAHLIRLTQATTNPMAQNLDLGDKDYISMLQRKHSLPHPAGTTTLNPKPADSEHIPPQCG